MGEQAGAHVLGHIPGQVVGACSHWREAWAGGSLDSGSSSGWRDVDNLWKLYINVTISIE